MSFYGNNDLRASKVVVFHYLMNNVVAWKVVWCVENFAWIELKEARVINGKELVESILVFGKRQSRKIIFTIIIQDKDISLESWEFSSRIRDFICFILVMVIVTHVH